MDCAAGDVILGIAPITRLKTDVMDVDLVPVEVETSKRREVSLLPRVSHCLKPTEGMYVKVPVFTSVPGLSPGNEHNAPAVTRGAAERVPRLYPAVQSHSSSPEEGPVCEARTGFV
ncbi:unnamed protein product [Arctogadus glacialis]